MQCPDCGHQAPVAHFGDPLRCPDCGIYYEKAIQLKAQADASEQKIPNSPSWAAPKASPASNGLSLKGFLTILFLGVGFLIVLVLPKPEKKVGENSASITSCGSSGMAHTMAGNFVKRELISPSTAKFPSSHEQGVLIVPLDKCRYQILSYVDSQNAFGAMIRSRFTVTMQSLEGGKSWRAHDLAIE